MNLKTCLYNLTAARNRAAALQQLQRLHALLPSPRARFAVPFVFRGCGHFRTIAPRQNPVEIETLYEAACDLRPRTVLEIGTARGGTLYLWAQAAADNATIVSVDLPGGDFGGAYPEARTPFYHAFARPAQHLELLRADSHSPQTLNRVKQLFTDRPIDFLFIDGDHTYEGVRADFEQYAPLVRPGGIVALHDILPRQDMPSIQVHRLWSLLQQQYTTRELVGPEGSGRTIGIGVIHVGDQPLTV